MIYDVRTHPQLAGAAVDVLHRGRSIRDQKLVAIDTVSGWGLRYGTDLELEYCYFHGGVEVVLD